MKRLLLIVFPLLLIVGCSKPISEENLIEEDGLKYHPDTKELYTGGVFLNHIGGKLHSEGSYRKGEKNKIWTYWYKNGQKEKEGEFIAGNENGLWTEWYENGQKEKEGGYSWSGPKYKLGLWTEWYENGQKKSEEKYEEGMLDGLWTRWYDNGQKKSEGNHFKYFDQYVHLLPYDGLQTDWYENGQKESETTWEMGKYISSKKWNEDGSVKE